MQAKVLLGRIWRNLNRRLSRIYVQSRLAESPIPLDRYGHGEGSWMAPRQIPEDAVIYCGGVGVDASFDFDLRKRSGAAVHSFDPTPKAIAYMQRENTVGVVFHEWGMLDSDSVVRFFLPLSEKHQSSFVNDLHNTGKYFEAQCYTLKTIMDRLGHDSIFLLKIDIEGSWYPFIKDFLAQGVKPDVLDVEFDSPAPIWRVREIVRRLEAAGYRAVFREKDNVTFLSIAGQTAALAGAD